KGYLYAFGWLGTAVHEIGHAIFAVIFGHKITEMKLFSPDPESGTLGYVSHSYNKRSIYQNIGNFFIGIGPIILGSLFLYLITYLLFRFNVMQLNSISLNIGQGFELSMITGFISDVWNSSVDYVHYIFYSGNFTWWKLVIALYVLFSVGSSITLSAPDVQGSMSGFVYFVITLLVFNLITFWLGDFTLNFFRQIGVLFSGFYFLIIISILINIGFIIILSFALVFKRNRISKY
ncbi:MAG: hypothetical protein PF590_07285, partial [Candidatus Delongbacteria bacterium]|nr:hypothetical protein [Candidatus Delongbacteria bacterium]